MRVRLPLDNALGQGAPGAEPHDEITEVEHCEARVLVIDDDDLVRRSIRRMLERDYDVACATSAREALDMLAHDADFDVLLCDLMLPNMDGRELHSALTRAYPELAGRVIFLTGGAFTAQTRAFVESTANPVLPKPVDQTRLQATIAGLLDPHG